MSENEEIYTAGKNFTLPPAVTALTKFTSDYLYCMVLYGHMKRTMQKTDPTNHSFFLILSGL